MPPSSRCRRRESSCVLRIWAHEPLGNGIVDSIAAVVAVCEELIPEVIHIMDCLVEHLASWRMLRTFHRVDFTPESYHKFSCMLPGIFAYTKTSIMEDQEREYLKENMCRLEQWENTPMPHPDAALT